MGNSLKQFASGSDEKKPKEIISITEEYYDTHIAGNSKSFAEFFQAVCKTIEEINKNLGNTQFRVPNVTKLREAYERYCSKDRTREEFQKILQELIMESGITGFGGAKDTLLYVFGVPVTALFIKQRVMPSVIPNEIFIPGITSITVFVLAKLNKI
ncbi:hypothetical protein FCV25MIE_14625 [Fagus crenata]